MTGVCLYHEEKSSFEEAQKFLQSSRWIPRQYVHRLAMAICSCRKFKGEIALAEELNVHIDYLKEFMESVNKDSVLRPPGVLLQWITECCDLPDSYSHVRLVTILYNAQHKDYKLLQRENVSSNKMDLPPQKKKRHKQTLTASQVGCIDRKLTSTVSVDWSTSHVPVSDDWSVSDDWCTSTDWSACDWSAPSDLSASDWS